MDYPLLLSQGEEVVVFEQRGRDTARLAQKRIICGNVALPGWHFPLPFGCLGKVTSKGVSKEKHVYRLLCLHLLAVCAFI